MDFETHVKQTAVALLAVIIATSGAYTGDLLGHLPTRADTADQGKMIVAATDSGDWSSLFQRIHWRQKQDQGGGGGASSRIGSSGSRQRSNASSNNGVCGDGIVQEHRGETCDLAGENLLENSGCNAHCLRTAICGNGTIEDAEECDEGVENGRGFCSETCKKHGESSDGRTGEESCGDGALHEDRGEACDDGNRENGDGCNAHCTRESPGNAPPKGRDGENADGNGTIGKPMPDIKSTDQSSGAAASASSASSASEEFGAAERLVLGCLTDAGEWTRDRSACAENQESMIHGQVVEIEENVIILAKPMKAEESEEVLKQKIAVHLLGVNRTEGMRQELLQSIRDTKERLRGLRGDPTLSEEVRDYLARSNEWLEKGETYFSDASRSAEEITMMVDPLKEVLRSASELVLRDRAATVTAAPQIDPILTRTETLLMKFRQSFIGLIQAGIAVDDAAVDAYIAAANTFIEVKAECTSDRTQCARLHEVLEKLQVAQGPLKAALDEHPEILREVESRF